MPLFGLGTYTMRDKLCYQAVLHALQIGYRLIDTASVYRNEEEVGKAIIDSGIPRKDLFITSKLKPHDHGNKAREACLATLKRLQLSYIDLYLIHWPGVAGKNPQDPELKMIRKETWLALVSLVNEGYIKTLGVSNYTAYHLDEFFPSSSSPSASSSTDASTTSSSSSSSLYPLVNQFELHPLLHQQSIIDKCNEHHIQIQSYATLARGHTDLLANPIIQSIATSHQLTPAQICLRWAIQHGWSVIPKSSQIERIEENLLALSGTDLTKEEMNLIDNLEMEYLKSHPSGGLRTCWDPTTIA